MAFCLVKMLQQMLTETYFCSSSGNNGSILANSVLVVTLENIQLLGEIIRTVCVCVCVYMSVCEYLLLAEKFTQLLQAEI
jgi:hypothetical protein